MYNCAVHLTGIVYYMNLRRVSYFMKRNFHINTRISGNEYVSRILRASIMQWSYMEMSDIISERNLRHSQDKHRPIIFNVRIYICSSFVQRLLLKYESSQLRTQEMRNEKAEHVSSMRFPVHRLSQIARCYVGSASHTDSVYSLPPAGGHPGSRLNLPF